MRVPRHKCPKFRRNFRNLDHFLKKKLMQLKLGVLWIENFMTADYPIRFASFYFCVPPSNAIET